MKFVNISCYESEDANKMEPRLRDSDRLGIDLRITLDNLVAANKLKGVAYPTVFSMYADNKIQMIYGMNVFYRGVGEWFTFFSKDVTVKYKKAMHKIAKRFIKYLFLIGFWRIQATIPATNYVSLKWHQALGFKEEAYLKKYGAHGEDYIITAMVVE
jgi:RimJ/RimL family protein N-acetyltransferase